MHGRRRLVLAAGGLIAALLSACGSPSPSRSPSAHSTATGTPSSTPTPDRCAIASAGPPASDFAADFPIALAFAPDGRLFIAERGGAIVVADAAGVHPFAAVPTVTTEAGGGYSERGLLGLAVSPTFATDRYVYAFYDTPDRQYQDLVRFTDCAGSGVGEITIARFPAGSDCCHKGGRLAFGIDGKLYATLGEEHVATAAQNTADARGKVLRLNPDGSIPADNPFGNSVFASGLRNPFGIAVAPDGTMLVTNNGPSGDDGSPGTGYDTAVLVTRGARFQWPLCYGYSHPLHGSCAGMTAPVWSSETATYVPTGAAWINAAGPAGLAGHFIFCSYARGGVLLTAASPAYQATPVLPACHLAVVQGPNNAVYYSDTHAVHIAR